MLTLINSFYMLITRGPNMVKNIFILILFTLIFRVFPISSLGFQNEDPETKIILQKMDNSIEVKVLKANLI